MGFEPNRSSYNLAKASQAFLVMRRNKTSLGDAMALCRPPYHISHGNHGELGVTLTWLNSYLFNDIFQILIFVSLFPLSHGVWSFSQTARRLFWWNLTLHNFKTAGQRWDFFLLLFVHMHSKRFLISQEFIMKSSYIALYGIGKGIEEETFFTTTLSTLEKSSEGVPRSEQVKHEWVWTWRTWASLLSLG